MICQTPERKTESSNKMVTLFQCQKFSTLHTALCAHDKRYENITTLNVIAIKQLVTLFKINNNTSVKK